MLGSLAKVTSDPTQPNQTVVNLGSFSAPNSAGWGENNLVQMQDAGGSVAVISLGGIQTVRFNGNAGDFDYLVFVPSALPLQLTGTTLVGHDGVSGASRRGMLADAGRSKQGNPSR